MVTIPVWKGWRFPNGTHPETLSLLPDAQYGLWSKRNYEFKGWNDDGDATFSRHSCASFDVSYTSFDGNWWAAIILQDYAWVLAIVLSIALLSSCRDVGAPLSKMTYRVIGLLLIVFCCTGQGMAFLVLTSNFCSSNPDLVETFRILGDQGPPYSNYCELGRGSYMVILSITLYFFTGLVCCCLVEPDDAKEEPESALEPGTVMTEGENVSLW
jgi:hypothetical protein